MPPSPRPSSPRERRLRIRSRPLICLVVILSIFVFNIIVAFVAVHESLVDFDEAKHEVGLILRRHKGRLKDISASLLDQSIAHVDSKQESFLNSTDVWHRMLQDNGTCNRSNTTLEVNDKSQSSNSSVLLRPFGFYDTVRSIVEKQDDALSSPLSFFSSTQSSTCERIPRTPQCHISQYSVILFSTGRNLRQVVTTIMAFQSYPSVSSINLLLQHSTTSINATNANNNNNQTTVQLKKYGKRIDMWKRQGVVNVIDDVSSVWDVIDTIRIGVDSNQTQSKQNSQDDPAEYGVLWIDADQKRQWTGTTFKRRLHKWSAQPYSLALKNPMGMNDKTKNDLPDKSQCTVDLDGLIMHPSLLCFLKHAATKEVQSYVGSLDSSKSWNLSIQSVGITLFFLADAYFVDSDDKMNRDNEQNQLDKKPTGDGIRSILEYFGGCSCSSIFHLPVQGLQQCTS